MGRVDGKVALISGGARGMGASHARALAAGGASVVAGDVLDDEGNALAEELGDAARFVHLDVTQPDQWKAVELPAAPYLHLFVARGRLNMSGLKNGAELAEDDAVRFTASNDIRVTAREACEILVWEMHTELGG